MLSLADGQDVYFTSRIRDQLVSFEEPVVVNTNSYPDGICGRPRIVTAYSNNTVSVYVAWQGGT